MKGLQILQTALFDTTFAFKLSVFAVFYAAFAKGRISLAKETVEGYRRPLPVFQVSPEFEREFLREISDAPSDLGEHADRQEEVNRWIAELERSQNEDKGQ